MTPSRDQLNAFTLTFLSYAVLSGCRAPMSVSKSVMRGSPPFDSDLALGALDSAFLFAYSLGMFATGVLADRALRPGGGIARELSCDWERERARV